VRVRSSVILMSVLGMSSCLVDLDLRGPPRAPAGDSQCGVQQRFDPILGKCLPCIYASPAPHLACPCAWQYLPADFPYCDAPDAYYTCLSCTGDIMSCNAFSATDNTSYDCSLLHACCDQLQDNPQATPCCPAGEELWCVFDPQADEASPYVVDCLAEPCCTGSECPGGSVDCQSWQDCTSGVCTPACEPGEQECQVFVTQEALACACAPVGSPP
jgi:hypothetical protein